MKRAARKISYLTLGVLALAAMVCIFPLNADADAIVTVGGTTYDIGTLTGSFSDNEATLESMPWFGNLGVALEFRDAVGLMLGTQPPPNGNIGVFFAEDDTSAPGNVFSAAVNTTNVAQEGFFLGDADIAIYATATIATTPEPGTLSLLFCGMLGVGLLVGMKRL